MDWLEIVRIGWPVLAAAAAWGGAKQALNGTRNRVVKLEDWADQHNKTHLELAERTARIETKIDIMMEKR